MKYIHFENKGVLDEVFIKSFGVSVKDNSDCIGYFGTGLKYALAILMREGLFVSIYSNNKHYKIGKESVTLSGKTFEFVTLNGERLPFTTELGKNWDLWQAYRELYSNAIDESGDVHESSSLPADTHNKTIIVVAGSKLNSIHNKREAIFVDRGEEILKHGNSFYSKGVKVWDYEGCPSIYSYNDKYGECNLTEDRQIKYNHEVHRICSNVVVQLSDRDIIRNIIYANRNTWESVIDYDYCTVEPSEEFLEVGLLDKDKIENKYLKRYLERHLPKTPLLDVVLSKDSQDLLEIAINNVTMAGYFIKDYPIRVVEKLEGNALGQALDKTIFISMRCFLEGGLEMLKATLIEEYAHLKYGYRDCNRDMQNWLFSEVVRLLDISNSLMKERYTQAA
jgi:hypothetical protein